MYIVIEKRTEIAEYQNIFRQSLTRDAKSVPFRFGHKGDCGESENFWSPGLGLCMGTRTAGEPPARYWNT
jgi:hypothetical protein